MTWHPISTAPRDGTVIDLYGTRNGEPRRFPNGRWKEIVWGGMRLGQYQWYHDSWDIYGDFAYTHWMPFPDPPESKE